MTIEELIRDERIPMEAKRELEQLRKPKLSEGFIHRQYLLRQAECFTAFDRTMASKYLDEYDAAMEAVIN